MLNAFGRNYEEIGSSDKGLILKNSGKVKIQWGKSYIDLLDNNGKINVLVLKLIKEVSSEDEITEDGFYLLDGVLKAKSGDNILEIVSNNNSSYISFLVELTLEEDLKYQALLNIGFFYKNINDVNTFPTNGIIYNELDSSLYIVYNGLPIHKYYSELPNEIRKPIKIKNSSGTEGALIIEGEGKDNSILFNSLLIYSDDLTSIINLEGPLKIMEKNPTNLLELEVLLFSNSSLKVDRIEALNSNGKTENFKIYPYQGKYYLEIDSINVKDSISIPYDLIPTRIYNKENVISTISEVKVNENPTYYLLTLRYDNEYILGDVLRMYISLLENTNDTPENVNEEELEELEELPLTLIYPIECVVTLIIDSNTVRVENFTHNNTTLTDLRFIGKYNIPCYLVESNSVQNEDLVIGLLSTGYGIISKNNTFYLTKFKDYPEYDSSLIADLETALSSNDNTYDNVLVPFKMIRDLSARITALGG